MTEFQNIIAALLALAGALFMLVGSLGILRLPDFYCRSHAASKADTLGIAVMLAGFAVYEGFSLNMLKLGVGIGFILLSNPVATHALARAALRAGLKPWFPPSPQGKEKSA